jgi:hypothetical protein
MKESMNEEVGRKKEEVSIRKLRRFPQIKRVLHVRKPAALLRY